MVGAIQYMTTDAISGKEEGKERITKALLGLLLAVGAWLILSTINPDLLGTGLILEEIEAPSEEYAMLSIQYNWEGSGSSGGGYCSSEKTRKVLET